MGQVMGHHRLLRRMPGRRRRITVHRRLVVANTGHRPAAKIRAPALIPCRAALPPVQDQLRDPACGRAVRTGASGIRTSASACSVSKCRVETIRVDPGRTIRVRRLAIRAATISHRLLRRVTNQD